MDPHHVKRLQEEQMKALQETKDKMAQMEVFRKDYKVLEDRLRNLADEVSYDVMVPFGKLAFMPGRLVHTNEVLVLLGDNWFVERSAKQAADIASRRIAAIDQQMKGLDDQLGLLLPRLDFMADLQQTYEQTPGGVVEIQEEYDEEKEKVWRAAHRKSVQRHREQERAKRKKQESKKPTARSQGEALTDEQLWARLDELEMKERTGREMTRLSEDTEEDVKARRRVQWEDEVRHAKPVRDEDKDSEDGEEEEEEEEESDDDESDDDTGDEKEAAIRGASRPSVIRFVHTSPEEMERSTESRLTSNAASQSTDGATLVPMVKSPGEIYHHFMETIPQRSILKPTRSPILVQEEDTLVPKRDKQVIPGSREAFSGAVVERQVMSLDQGTVAPPAGQQTDQPAKRVSKFKAQRLQQGRR